MKSKLFQKFGGGSLEKFGIRLWTRLQFSALKSRKDREIVDMLWQMQVERRTLMTAFEAFYVYAIARAQSKMKGAFAEVGVYKGASAKLICENKGDRVLRLFDTFEGLPEATKEDRGVHRVGQYACSLEAVKEYLHSYSTVEYYQGIFPDSAVNVPEDRYALAHFDVDLYQGTLACLQYFYPRMVPGGVILSHDYGLLAGVEQAFQEFFADKPEGIIEQPTTQCLVVKQ